MSSVKETFSKIRKSLAPRRRNSVPIVDTPSRLTEPETRRNEILIYRKNSRELRATRQRINRDQSSPNRVRRRIELDNYPQKKNQKPRPRSISLGERTTIPPTSDSEIIRRANLAATTNLNSIPLRSNLSDKSNNSEQNSITSQATEANTSVRSEEQILSSTVQNTPRNLSECTKSTKKFGKKIGTFNFSNVSPLFENSTETNAQYQVNLNPEQSRQCSQRAIVRLTRIQTPLRNFPARKYKHPNPQYK